MMKGKGMSKMDIDELMDDPYMANTITSMSPPITFQGVSIDLVRKCMRILVRAQHVNEPWDIISLGDTQVACDNVKQVVSLRWVLSRGTGYVTRRNPYEITRTIPFICWREAKIVGVLVGVFEEVLVVCRLLPDCKVTGKMCWLNPHDFKLQRADRTTDGICHMVSTVLGKESR